MEQQITNWQEWMIVAGFAACGGGLHYGLKVKEGRKFVFWELCLHMGISAFAGLISFSGLTHFGADPTFAGSLSGVAGWMGTRFLRIGELLVYRKTETNKEDVEI